MEGLIVEVSDLSRRNDELMTSKDSDLVVIRDLDAQLKEYKRKYEQAKTELRSVKGILHSHTVLSSPGFTFKTNSHVCAVPTETQIRRPTAGDSRWCYTRRTSHRLLDRHRLAPFGGSL
jgi:hypothetical protein